MPADASARENARRTLGLCASAFVIGTVARLNPVKDLGVVLGAFALLRKRAPEAHLVIVGDGPERHGLEQRAAELACADAVTFTGHRDDAGGCFRRWTSMSMRR